MTPSPHLPNLSKLADKLAGNNARVSRYIDSLPMRIDTLAAAVNQQDWSEVRRIADQLVRTAQTFGCPAIGQAAEALLGELDKPHNAAGIKLSLQRVLGLQGGLRRPHAALEDAARPVSAE